MKSKISLQGSVSKGWLHREGGFSFGEGYYRDPMSRWKQDRGIDLFLNTRFPEYNLCNMEANLVQAEFYNEDQVLIGGFQPNLIIAVLLGSKFVFYPDKDPDIKGIPLAGRPDISELPPPSSLLEHPLIQELDKQILSIHKNEPGLRAIPPFFWDISGRATIHGFITTSQKLVGEAIFLALFDNPEWVQSLHSWIAEVYLTLIRHYSDIGDLKVSSVHIGECSGSMLSMEQYKQFIVPHACILGKSLGPLRLHSCGCSDHQLEAMSGIDNLSVIDTGSGTSVSLMRKIFGKERELNIEPPMGMMMEESDRSRMENWLEMVIQENDGGPLKIAYHLDAGYSLGNCLAIHDWLCDRGLIEKGRRALEN